MGGTRVTFRQQLRGGRRISQAPAADHRVAVQLGPLPWLRRYRLASSAPLPPATAGAIDCRSCAIGCAALTPSSLAQWEDSIRLVESTFSQRHAPDSRRPRQPACGPSCPLGRPAAADPAVASAGGAADPPPATAAALNGLIRLQQMARW
jgi:hypothetical protein